MCGLGIYVAAGNVRFNLIAVNADTCAGVIDGVQQGKQLTGLVSVTSIAKAINDQMAACVYWPAFSRMPGA
jgi:hypothetical protein